MSQLELRLLGRIDAPSMVPKAEIDKINSYTEAVIASWVNRRIRDMSKSALAGQTGMRASHLTDYFNPRRIDSKGRELREMPAKHIPLFEAATGNTFVSQWLAAQSKLTILELLIAEAA